MAMAETQVPFMGAAGCVAPVQQTMAFEATDGVMVQQETNLCCRCCCCQPNINYRMQTYTEDYQAGTDLAAMWYIKENAGFLGRCLSCVFPGAKKTVWTVHVGGDESGPVLMTHEKEMTCSHCPAVFVSDSEILRIPMCCCLPYLTTRDAAGRVLGTSKYICDMWLFVPKFDVFDADEQHIFRIRPDTCCCGCCVRCRCGRQGQQGQQGQGQRRGGKFRVPFQIREPVEPYNQIADAAITDLWAGFVRTCCTKQETLGVKFPAREGVDMDAMKATLVGTTLLLNTLLYDNE